MWKLDDDGDAFNADTDQFISCGKIGNGFAVYVTVGKKGLRILDFAFSEGRARYLIWELVNQLNEEETQNDRRPMDKTPA